MIEEHVNGLTSNVAEAVEGNEIELFNGSIREGHAHGITSTSSNACIASMGNARNDERMWGSAIASRWHQERHGCNTPSKAKQMHDGAAAVQAVKPGDRCARRSRYWRVNEQSASSTTGSGSSIRSGREWEYATHGRRSLTRLTVSAAGGMECSPSSRH